MRTQGTSAVILRLAMRDTKTSVETLAATAGFSEEVIGQYVNGDASPNLGTLQTLLRAMDRHLVFAVAEADPTRHIVGPALPQIQAQENSSPRSRIIRRGR